MPLLPLLLLLLLLPPAAVAGKVRHSPSFALDFFPGDGAIAQLALTAANATPAGAIAMRSPHARVQYHSPIRFAAADAGFSTYFSFSFSLRPAPKSRASLAFFLKPAAAPPTAHALSVAFDAADPTNIRIQTDFAGAKAGLRTGLSAAGAHKLHSWIDYNATSATLRVGLSASGPRDGASHLLQHLDLSAFLRGGGGGRNRLLLAGLASAHANCTLFSWAFRANTAHPYLMHSLPLDPAGLSLATPPADRLHRAASSPYHWLSLLLAAAAGAALTFFVLFVWYSMAARRPVAPVEYPMHPSSDDVVYEKIVLVGVKDMPSAHLASAGNNK
ncbi:uncharacterized protein LOC124672303 [Lolium rigidum]|uniref:uncharacterized protein LOC124672303 n=1 Tax=Lolium rigidum TaxID=89674 RepID=UPI001F5D0E42|nr:uncharacterized protein LOC124672303 [Lolium rigidum]